MASDDVAKVVARVAVGPPVNGIVESGGSEQVHLDAFIRRVLSERHDPRQVLTDPQARYYGATLSERTLVPDDGAILGKIRFDDWLSQSSAGEQAAA